MLTDHNDTCRMVQMQWDKVGDPVETPANDLGSQIRSDVAATPGYGDLAVYVNYAHGDEKPKQTYGARKLPRLAKLKAKYDPDNVFRYYHALPTSYP